MGPVSRGAAVAFQREISSTLREIVQELRFLRGTINTQMGGNALDHETFVNRFETVESRVYTLEREAPGKPAS